MVFKKDLTPLTKGGAVHKHAGKGSSAAPMPNRNTLQKLQKSPSNTINDYSKATPMANTDTDVNNPGTIGLGSGDWAGNGM